MENKGEQNMGKEISEEDLLDFELEDLSPDDLGEAAGPGEADEEILELVDLVEEGKRDELKDSFDGEIEQLLREEEMAEAATEGATAQTSDLQEVLDEAEPHRASEMELDLSDLSLSDLAVEGEGQPGENLADSGERAEMVQGGSAEEEPTAAIEMDLGLDELEPEAEPVEEGLPEGDIERMLEGGPPEEAVLEPESPEEAPDEGFIDLGEAEEETGLKGAEIGPQPGVAALDTEQPEAETPPTQGPLEAAVGISEERIEAIVSKVVEEVVERVARETMASVAERVITEAIDALKQSLRPASE